MRRHAFILGAASAALAARTRAEESWPFPGTLAIFARRIEESRPIVSLHASLRLPSASTIKLVIAAAIARRIDAGTLSWSDDLLIRAHDIVGSSEAFGHVPPGSTASVRALMRAMIARSDNTAGNVLADHCSFVGVNYIAQSLGLAQTRLRRHFMDFAARARGIDNTTSAADMGSLLLGIAGSARGLRTDVASTAGCRAIVDIMLGQEDRDTIPAALGRGIPIANKTGVLPDVRNDIAIVDPYGRKPYVVALLSRFPPRDASAAYARLREIAAEVNARAVRWHATR